jgi:hypothetical protein
MEGQQTRYTVVDKLAIVEEWLAKKELKVPLKTVARHYDLQPSQLKRWVAKVDELRAAAKESPTQVTLGRGRPSMLEPFKEELLQWLFEFRQDGMAVSVRMFRLKVSEVIDGFRRRPMQTQYSVLKYWGAVEDKKSI